MATEQERNYGRNWRAANQERVRTNRKRYSEKNREKIRLATAAWIAANPERRREYGKQYRADNVVRIAARRKQHHASNRTRIAEDNLRRKYGMTLAQKSALLQTQNGCCAICASDRAGGKGWVVDHDHATGKVRGVLCGKCNVALGLLRDSVDTLTAAIAYLRKNGG
jgi:hypothetical protein